VDECDTLAVAGAVKSQKFRSKKRRRIVRVSFQDEDESLRSRLADRLDKAVEEETFCDTKEKFVRNGGDEDG
jgi:hypothetical protein